MPCYRANYIASCNTEFPRVISACKILTSYLDELTTVNKSERMIGSTSAVGMFRVGELPNVRLSLGAAEKKRSPDYLIHSLR